MLRTPLTMCRSIRWLARACPGILLLVAGCSGPPDSQVLARRVLANLSEFERARAMAREGTDGPGIAEVSAKLGIKSITSSWQERYGNITSMLVYSRGTVAAGFSVSVVHADNVDPELVKHHETISRVKWLPVAPRWWVEVAR
jgi:hypothetical protein